MNSSVTPASYDPRMRSGGRGGRGSAAEGQSLVGTLGAVPPAVTVHGVVPADDRCDLSPPLFGDGALEGGDERLTAPWATCHGRR